MGLPLARTLCRVSLVMVMKQWYRLTLGMLDHTKRFLSHIRQLDGTLGARSIHEPVAALWVKLCRCDDLC